MKPCPTIHELKTWPSFFAEVESGHKTFELRKDDRGFERGDVLELHEWDPEQGCYTGRATRREVSYVLRSADALGGLADGYVILGFALPRTPDLDALPFGLHPRLGRKDSGGWQWSLWGSDAGEHLVAQGAAPTFAAALSALVKAAEDKS